MMHDDDSSRFIMAHHDASSRVIITHHDSSSRFIIFSHQDASDCIMIMHHDDSSLRITTNRHASTLGKLWDSGCTRRAAMEKLAGAPDNEQFSICKYKHARTSSSNASVAQKHAGATSFSASATRKHLCTASLIASLMQNSAWEILSR